MHPRTLNRLVLSIAAAAICLSTACHARSNSPSESGIDGDGAQSAKQEDPQPGEISPMQGNLVDFSAKGFKHISFDPKPLQATAHRGHLADPMKFTPLPDQSLPKGKTAVVGSRVCVLYPEAKLASPGDLAALPAGVPIPFGTIIPILGEKVGNPEDKEHREMFQFQDNWNWFYHAKYKGRSGLVFGADLYGIDDTNEDNRVSARLYQSTGSYDSFYPILGYRKLSKAVTDRIERDRLAIQSVSPKEYDLSGYRSDLLPDDMLALYDKHRPAYYELKDNWRRKTPVFVTTDLAAHTQHLMFDRTLQYLEEAFFLPRLKELNAAFLSALKAREAEAGGYEETLAKAEEYFQVAQALLDLAPDRVANARDDYKGDPFKYIDKDEAAVLAAYPAEVRDEIAKIDKAEGRDNSSVFAFKNGVQSTEDYSQYKPRGHYTKNGALSAYFRAMMWFGRVHFLIAEAGPVVLKDAPDPTASSDSEALTLAMEPIALLITDLVRKDDDLYKDWGALFDPITALIGDSDDLSFKEVLPLWRDEKVSEKDFGAWAGDKDKLLAFMRKAHDKLRPPAISGNSVWWGPSEGAGREAPMGWRLFGQRFTYDSAIHDQVSPPRLMSRDMVRGLDIMKAFGSKTADELLASSDYPKMEGLQDRLDGIEKEFSSYKADFWEKNYYNGVLFQAKAQAQFEPGTGFYFTEGKGWAVKAMLSSHGTWSELRHDTLLYAKQSGAERAGDGDFEPTFRTEAIPDPVHYLEPNLPFWQGSALSVQNLLKTLDKYRLLDEETAKDFGKLEEIYAKAAEIADLEVQDRKVGAEDVKWIATIPSEFIYLVLTHVEGGDILDKDQLRMAIVADVFTNYEIKRILETAVGIPYRIYVPLNDSQGGKRIAVGYVFSYYEFENPISERMTDEAWKAIVYKPNADLGRYLPFWERNAALPSEE